MADWFLWMFIRQAGSPPGPSHAFAYFKAG